VEYDVIIIGAGASGLMSAISAARQGCSVLVIEQKDKAGKKILATGNGKCNFTNLNQDPDCYRCDDSAFAMKVLSCFDVKMTLEFFEELGIYPKNRDGYIYPNSEQASSIVAVLMMECERLKVQFHYNESVKEIRKPHYTVVTEAMIIKDDKNSDRKKKSAVTPEIKQYTYHTRKIILATGGCASPKLGSDGSGYLLAKVLGHSIMKPLPALVQLKSPDKYCKTVSGVRTNAVVTVFTESQMIAREEGEILFADYGISGIPIMQVSRFAAKALDKGSKVHLLLDFLPEISQNELLRLLNNRRKQHPHKNLEEMMVGLFNNKLSYVILLEAKLDPYKSTRALSEKELIQLVNQIKEFKMIINDTNSFDNAQVCTGGVPTSEIDRNTMESKYSKGLYLVGELVDVDGTCGGYNLQWAWSSGYLAGMACGKIN
jgi:predicted Rossmann fold flavoprotein